MVGRNPLWVAKEHGHRITTMLSVYAAWIEGAVETNVAVITHLGPIHNGILND